MAKCNAGRTCRGLAAQFVGKIKNTPYSQAERRAELFSRVMLDSDKDQFGKPRAQLRWRVTRHEPGEPSDGSADAWDRTISSLHRYRFVKTSRRTTVWP